MFKWIYVACFSGWKASEVWGEMELFLFKRRAFEVRRWDEMSMLCQDDGAMILNKAGGFSCQSLRDRAVEEGRFLFLKWEWILKVVSFLLVDKCSFATALDRNLCGRGVYLFEHRLFLVEVNLKLCTVIISWKGIVEICLLRIAWHWSKLVWEAQKIFRFLWEYLQSIFQSYAVDVNIGKARCS
jgi:hypothetical protein